jgi:hypothetical protein
MKYEVGQLVKIKDDISLPVRYYIGLVMEKRLPDQYDILCVGDKEPDIFFESEIIGAIE